MPKTATKTPKSDIRKGEVSVVVTTAHRGVFFGYAKQAVIAAHPRSLKLRRARNCVYWGQDLRGFMGLASVGPTDSCRIGPAVDLLLHDITCVAFTTDEAADRWEAAPW